MRWRSGGGTVAKRRGGGVIVPAQVPDAASEGGEDRASSAPKNESARLIKALYTNCE